VCARDMRPLGEDAEGDGGQDRPRAETRAEAPRTSAVVIAFQDSRPSLLDRCRCVNKATLRRRRHEGEDARDAARRGIAARIAGERRERADEAMVTARRTDRFIPRGAAGAPPPLPSLRESTSG
jgi:hypothetical protein